MLSLVRSYTDQIPPHTLEAVAKSFLFSFALGTAVTGNPYTGLICGGLAGSVSLVSNVTVPIFKKIWGRETEHWYEFAGRTFIATAAVSGLAGLVGFNINLVATAALTLFLLCVSGCKDRSINLPSLSLVV